MGWYYTNTKYGCEMPVSELLKVVADIEYVSGLSIYDILMFLKEGYTLQKVEQSSFYDMEGFGL